MLQFWNSVLIATFHSAHFHLNGFGEGLLANEIASLIYKLSGKKTGKPINLKRKMELNENATTHLANKEIVIPMTMALDHPKTQRDSHL